MGKGESAAAQTAYQAVEERLRVPLDNVPPDNVPPDNPVERKNARPDLPGVLVLDMPVDPSTYATWLPSSPHLERIALSASDRARSERYGARGALIAPRRECSIGSTPPRAGATPASPTRIASPARGSARSARATAIRAVS
jgi:hypothetical protein